ncbi:MAG TPA: ATP-dependent RNA helicase HrpA [Steroidobacteraceae bacterium]
MRIEYDPALPITAHRQEILEAIARHRVLIVCGATGSGKSTQLPKMCLEAARGTAGMIGHTQPRRIAARALASRLAQELAASGPHPAADEGIVGFQVRFTDHTGPQTRVKFMTDGILLQELESDRYLHRYDTLIIDEAHERSLNIDLLLGVLRRLAPSRPDLRIIVTSATIDPERFSRYFAGAPIIEVSGRSYPVEIRYYAQQDAATELSLPDEVLRAVRELDATAAARGDILVFLPGEKWIREVAEVLRKAQLQHTEILPLFARLAAREQQRIFAPHAQRRIVLATNVAETSLTVPGIRFVIDSGLARISRYSPRSKIQRLPIERISQASADQRKGRCGREAQGICIRLYSEEELARQEPFTAPEVLRTNLASVILRMATLGLGSPEDFPFLDPPDTRLVNDGVRLLQELQAMDEQRRVTSLGEQIGTLPVDPRLGRMLLAATRLHCVTEMLIIASFLEAQDPRERPTDSQQQAGAKHALFADARSDFVSALNLWRAFHEQSAALSGNQLRKWCREHFLSFLRMREWQELHAQLERALRQLPVRANQHAARYAELHQGLLTGFLGSIGRLDEKREYAGPRGLRFMIAPGTPLAARPPKWLVAGSLVETTRLYARMVAAVDPGWIEAAGAHLLKYRYSEPHWESARGFVAAFATISLFGLTLVAKRRVAYGSIAPLEARELFIREALLADNGIVQGAFLDANRRMRAEAERLEAKIRRRDILVDEQALVNFYAARIPERISSIAAFEHWRARAQRSNPHLLHMAAADVMRRDAPDAGPECFPDELAVGVNRLPLQYRFDPAASDDGLTLRVPQPLLDTLDADQLAWLVPGMQLEKVIAVLRALPKAVRKQLVPVPEHARAALEEVRQVPLPGFHASLAQWIGGHCDTALSAAALAALALPQHLRMNIRVVDEEEHIVAEGRDLSVIRRKFVGIAAPRLTPALHRAWDFGDLPPSRAVQRNHLQWVVYPAIEDRGTGVALVEARTPAAAELLSRAAVARLAMLQLPQQVKYVGKRIADDRQLVLLSGGLPIEGSVAEALTRRAFRECFVGADAGLPQDRPSFTSLLDSRRGELGAVADRLATLATAILQQWRTVRAALAALRAGVAGAAVAAALADIEQQLRTLLPPDFLESTPRPWLEHIPRYLTAIARRLARLPANQSRDAQLAARAKAFSDWLQSVPRQPSGSAAAIELARLRWMLEELRVSLFAQELKTALPVSPQRLNEQLEVARAALAR